MIICYVCMNHDDRNNMYIGISNEIRLKCEQLGVAMSVDFLNKT